MSALTVKKAIDVLHHILRGRVDDRLGEKWLIDQAGQSLAALQPTGWRWAAQQEITLDFTAGQSFVRLPEHSAFVRSVRYNDAQSREVRQTTISRIHEMRSIEGGVDSSNIYYALSYSNTGIQKNYGAPQPVLEIWPIPAADQTDALIAYIGGDWRTIENLEDDDFINLPVWMVPVFYLVLEAWAGGTHREAQGSLVDRLDRVRQSAFFQTALTKDAALQMDLGPPRGGYLERTGQRNLDVFIDRSSNLDVT